MKHKTIGNSILMSTPNFGNDDDIRDSGFDAGDTGITTMSKFRSTTQPNLKATPQKYTSVVVLTEEDNES